MNGPFTTEIIGWAQAAEKKWQIPASLILSAAKLESNLGAATPPGSNNWFGIKDPRGVVARTSEQTAGGASYVTSAGFKIFATPAEGFLYYGQLLGLGAPYNGMVKRFLNSPRGEMDVQALSKSLTGVYATDVEYGAKLIAVQTLYNLYQYDNPPQGAAMPNAQPSAPPVAPAPAVVAALPTPKPVAAAPAADTSVPTVSQSTTIDWGAFAAQLLNNEAPILAAAASGGISLLLSELPFGSIISMFIGPTVISQYISQALTALEGVLSKESITIPASDMIATTAAALFKSNEPALAAFLGPTVESTIAALVAKLKL